MPKSNFVALSSHSFWFIKYFKFGQVILSGSFQSNAPDCWASWNEVRYCCCRLTLVVLFVCGIGKTFCHPRMVALSKSAIAFVAGSSFSFINLQTSARFRSAARCVMGTLFLARISHHPAHASDTLSFHQIGREDGNSMDVVAFGFTAALMVLVTLRLIDVRSLRPSPSVKIASMSL